MILIKINEYKHFVLYENEKTGAREAFLYTDLGGEAPDRIDTKRIRQSGRLVVEGVSEDEIDY